jgi:anti-sigma regulatory factor (Ser/Thr protein kinase)
MTAVADTPLRFSHEALLYAGHREFAERCAAFVREGLDAGEPVLVMVTADKIELLRAELGESADRVSFVDMAEAGRNPGRIISAWGDFAAEHLAQGRRLRGIGEPIWAGRSPDELVECQHHESLLNLAFGDADGFRLLCPYDTAALPQEVIEEARRSHPLVLDGEALRECRRYRAPGAAAVADRPLPPPRAPSQEIAFGRPELRTVRRFVSRQAAEAGLPAQRAEDLVVAVNEVTTNSVRHGGGGGVFRIWHDGEAIVCEIRDRGLIEQPLVGRRRPVAGAEGGHGLWMANQVCDLVQVRSRRSGTVVRLHMRLPAPAPAARAAGADQPPTRA